MKKIYKSILSAGSFVIGLLLTTQVVAQQKGDYLPFVHLGYSEYNIKYNPESTNIVNGDGETTITTAHSNFAFEKIKIFVPPGSKRFYAKFQTYLNPTEAKATVRFGEIPVKNINDINQVAGFSEIDKTLIRLIAGDELVFYSPGGSGALSISQPSSTDDARAEKGGYIYINLLSIPGGKIHGVQTRMVVDEACYRSWYASAQWDAQGNPDENATHTCAGSTGGTSTPTVPALTGITLSRTTWNAATDAADTTVTVTPRPTGAVLPACTSSSNSLLTAGPVSTTEAQFVVNPVVLTSTTAVTINCGGKTAALNLQTSDTIATVSASDILLGHDANGKAQLTITLHHTDAEVAAKTKKVDYWVAALVPTDFPFFGQDEWFFLTAPSVLGSGYQWVQMQNSLDVKSVAFEKDVLINSISKTKKLTIPLGFDALEFKRINAKIYLVYSQGLGEFREVGTIWDASTYVVP